MDRSSRSLNDILAQHTEQPIDKIERDVDRDNFMSAVAAKSLRPGRLWCWAGEAGRADSVKGWPLDRSAP